MRNTWGVLLVAWLAGCARPAPDTSGSSSGGGGEARNWAPAPWCQILVAPDGRETSRCGGDEKDCIARTPPGHQQTKSCGRRPTKHCHDRLANCYATEEHCAAELQALVDETGETLSGCYSSGVPRAPTGQGFFCVYEHKVPQCVRAFDCGDLVGSTGPCNFQASAFCTGDSLEYQVWPDGACLMTLEECEAYRSRSYGYTEPPRECHEVW
jgi:hypothetical protein